MERAQPNPPHLHLISSYLLLALINMRGTQDWSMTIATAHKG